MKRTIPLILAGAVLLLVLASFLLQVRDIRMEGNVTYTKEELTGMLFPGRLDRSVALCWLRERFGSHRELPFVEKYSLSFTGLTSVSIRIYEKSLAGYLAFQDYCLYFDWDGTIVESSTEKRPDLLCVSGLNPSYAVLGAQLPVGDASVYRMILSVSQYLTQNRIEWNGRSRTLMEIADEMILSGGETTLVFGSIRVFLGGTEHLEEKLGVMTDILPELSGRSGTLYLDSWTEGAAHPSYIFR